MADNRQYTALEWVVKEIKVTLQEVQQVLERYVSNPEDITQLRFCQTLLHQVYGSLHMVGFHGAALVAEEMETLTQSLLNQSVENRKEAIDVLVDSVLQLPNYLEQVQEVKQDYPALIVSLLNDLRSVRGAGLVSESTLFSPNLDHAHKVIGAPHAITKNSKQFKAIVAKLRQLYQYAAASVIQQINTEENLAYLLKSTDRLEKLLKGTKHHAVWEVAHVLAVELYQKRIKPSVALKNLLRELDAELKVLQVNGSVALGRFPPDELVKNLLYYISSTPSDSNSIAHIKELYQLKSMLPMPQAGDKESKKPIDLQAIRAVTAAIHEEFVEIKVRLDECLEGSEEENLEFIQNALQRVNDTLAILGVGDLRHLVNESLNSIIDIRNQTETLSKSQLIDTANKLADLEVGLDKALSSSQLPSGSVHQLSEAQGTAVEECRNGLETAKDAIVDYISAQWEISCILNVPDLLRQVRGNLSILSLNRAADILSACILYVDSKLIAEGVKPNWQQLDSLADVIASVDYYLEFMSIARENDLSILDKAEKGLGILGVAKAIVQPIRQSETAETKVEPVSEGIVEDEIDDEIDEEVAEIFVEEFYDVLEQLKENFPQWASNFESENALAETRRAFHTLKGSGRMVKATEVGELSWSVENMLNRIVDHTISAETVHVKLIEKVISILPDMVEAYKNRLPNPHASLTEQYMAWGHQLSVNEKSKELLAGLSEHASTEAASDSEKEHSSISEPPSEEEITKEIDTEVAIGACEPANGEIDISLWEIFKQEAESHLVVVEDYIRAMEEVKPSYELPSDAMQLALHTLKGSAYMAELNPIAELVTPLEKFVKELRSYQVNIDDDIFQLIKDSVSYTYGALEQIANHQYPKIPKYDQFVARLDELRERSVGPLIRLQEAEKAQQKVNPAILEVLMAEEMNLLLDADLMINTWREWGAAISDWEPLRDELIKLNHGAERANLPTLARLSEALRSVYQQLIDGAFEASNESYDVMLAGHNQLMDIIDAIAAGQDLPPDNIELLEQLEGLPKLEKKSEPLVGLQNTEVAFEQEVSLKPTTLEIANQNLEEQQDLPKLDEIEATSISEEHIDRTPQDDRAAEHISVESDLNEERQRTENLTTLNTEELPVADMTTVLSVDEQTTTMDSVDKSAEQLIEPNQTKASFEKESPEHQELSDLGTTGADALLVDKTDSEIMPEDTSGGLRELNQEPLLEKDTVESKELVDLNDLTPVEKISEVLADEQTTEIVSEEQKETQEIIQPTNNSETDGIKQEALPELEVRKTEMLPGDEISSESDAPSHLSEVSSSPDDDFDPEIVDIFLEEAHELLEELDETINDWENGADDRDSNAALQRTLHTIKGGARLAGLVNLGDLAHNFEAYLIANAKDQPGSELFETIHKYQDQLIAQSNQVNQAMRPGSQQAVVNENKETSAEPVVSVVEKSVEKRESTETDTNLKSDESNILEADVVSVGKAGSNVVPFITKPTSTGLDILKSKPGAPTVQPQATAAVARRNQPQEVVKVSADLMEELVNLAGETSISRGRMEEQISELSHSLDEMGSTVQRLQEQLRRLDIETEAQIIFRQEQMAEMEGFDPLEMDRYSQLQQLSRSLIESASDLLDLKSTIAEKTRDAETVLLQQSRINTDLQEGLMRSRMVPFSRVVPRLRRIVRQIATELNKDVNLELDNIEGELDRTMMERMVAPIEHMLRNAIDHGIEDSDTRLQRGKPPEGRIIINLDRDGSDVLIHVADDGGGINVSRVREKAIERQLMSPEAQLSDQEVLQFILHAGFSTAETITQISGRGVGMDVVNSEIRQMGGSIIIDSREGEGTAFTIRVPFTVSVNRALMVIMGEDRYAVPLNSIEGIVRISPYELEHYYTNPDEPFEYAGQQYHLRYLGALLDANTTPRLEGHTMPLPIILVRSADHTMAVQVDQLQGSREIVVKSLGPQFKSVQGVSGATIMGDGNVVVILDLNALIRSDIAMNQTYLKSVNEVQAVLPSKRNRLVMVVDDSVTVRKVTSRLLEREGFDVITAKDGVDAMTTLQDTIPDIMLLDIEMPRMDGFEVAKNVRSSSSFKNLPIIMITSRTGEKHRQRGLESGANLYMGKPYQEEQLLESINELIGVKDSAHV